MMKGDTKIKLYLGFAHLANFKECKKFCESDDSLPVKIWYVTILMEEEQSIKALKV